ncbi:MAG: ring-hydroxylating oxygenase subunit alpha [Pseudomonadota bacterium]
MSTQLSVSEYNQLKHGFDRVASRSWSIHTRCYQDRKFLSVDREQIFHRSWQYLCHEQSLSNSGDYVALKIQGQSVFAVRGDDDELRAFYNVCKHRGHELVTGEGTKKSITCPYHAWRYGLDGKLQGARRSELIEGFDPGTICLHAIRVEVFCHLVFVNLDPNCESLSTQAGNLSTEIQQFAPDLGQLKLAKKMSYTIEANWKAVVDNFLECYHCPVAHRDFCSLVEMDTYKVKTHGIYSSHMAKAGRSENSAYAISDASVTDHAVWYLWPNTTLMRYPGRGNFMVWRFVPIGPEQTYEEFDIFYTTSEPTLEEEQSLAFIDSVLQPEDIALVESVQRGLRTPAFDQGRYLVDPGGSGLSEHAVHHFHSLLLDAYRGACES